MTDFDFYSIGHSNVPAERFVTLLRGASVSAVADVRTVPFSWFCPWFSAKNLAPLLAREGMDYLSCGDALGGRPRDASLYCNGVADYEAMARLPDFAAGIERLLADAAQRRDKGRICLMCAEREPLECHRCLLVARTIAERGLTIGHIRHDGTIEPHTTTEERLLESEGKDGDLFVTGQDATGLGDRLAAAYRSRARAVAYRVTGAERGETLKKSR